MVLMSFAATLTGLFAFLGALTLLACSSVTVVDPPAGAGTSTAPGTTTTRTSESSSTGGATDTAPPDQGPVTITDSGSTNAPGFTLTVTPQGQVSWHLAPPKNLPNPLPCKSADGTASLGVAATAQLFHDLAAAEPFTARQFDNCAKSTSFGTWTSVDYAGASIRDVECGSSTDARAEALTADVMSLEQTVSGMCM
jgi:hypothetical protein